MGTRITLNMFKMSPTETIPTDAYPMDPSSFTIPHVESGWCQGAGATYLGNQSWMVAVLVFEPEQDVEE